MKYEKISLVHICSNVENMCKMKIWGPHVLVVWLVFLAKFANMQQMMFVYFDSTTQQ